MERIRKFVEKIGLANCIRLTALFISGSLILVSSTWMGSLRELFVGTGIIFVCMSICMAFVLYWDEPAENSDQELNEV